MLRTCSSHARLQSEGVRMRGGIVYAPAWWRLLRWGSYRPLWWLFPSLQRCWKWVGWKSQEYTVHRHFTSLPHDICKMKVSVVGALGLKTCTSKNALCCCRPQQPSVLISKWAASSLLAVEYDRKSPDRSWRGGSTCTSWDTSDMTLAEITALIVADGWKSSHWAAQRMINSEWATTGTCSRQKGYSCQSYLRQRVSQKASLCREKPWFSMGSATGQLEQPFSLATSNDCWRFCGSCKGAQLLFTELPSCLSLLQFSAWFR